MRKNTIKGFIFLLSVLIISSSTSIAWAKDTPKSIEFEKNIRLLEYNTLYPEYSKTYTDEAGLSYELTNRVDTIDEPIEFDKIYEHLTDKDQSFPEYDVNPNNPSEKGHLANVVYSDTSIKNRTQTVTKTLEKSNIIVGTNADMPKNIDVTFNDKDTSKKINATLPLSKVKTSDEFWKSTEPLTGTVYNYDAFSYSLNANGKKFPTNANKPVYKGYENEIFSYLKLSPEIYKITGSSWTSDVYTNDKGQLCRDFSYNAQVKCYNCTTIYQDSVNLPDIPEYSATVHYSNDKSRNVKIILTYTEIQNTNTTLKIVFGVALGILLLAILIVVILYVVKKKKAKNSEPEKSIYIDKIK